VGVTSVPIDGPVRLGSVQLPEGRQISGWSGNAPRLWATSPLVEDAARVWRELADMHEQTGLVPFLLAFLDEGNEGRPWDEGELSDEPFDPSSADHVDAASVLAENWRYQVPPPGQLDDEWMNLVAPYGIQFPGLAPAQGPPLSEAELTRALGWFGPARIGLIPAPRPADVLGLLGHDTVNRLSDPAKLAAVLRSWEDRFGAVLVEIGFAHIRLLARRPPRMQPEAFAVAAELWALCDEFWPIDRPGTAVWDISEIAEQIQRIPIWSLWLD
jgi:hypothetical protein